MTSGTNNLEVVKIGKAKPADDVIEHAEAIMRWAKAGQLRSLMWIGENADGSHTHGMTTRVDDYKNLAYLERLKHRINSRMDDELCDPTEPEEDDGTD
jgi:hypothetical protein